MEDVDTREREGGGGTPLFKRKKVIFAGAIVVVAIGFLAYIATSQFATYYVTVSEYAEQADSLADERIRVAGHVLAESVDWDTESFTLSFTLVDGQASLPVVYSGVVPDTFKADSDIVVEGSGDPRGVFHADKLVTRCPSKYEPAG